MNHPREEGIRYESERSKTIGFTEELTGGNKENWDFTNIANALSAPLDLSLYVMSRLGLQFRQGPSLNFREIVVRYGGLRIILEARKIKRIAERRMFATVHSEWTRIRLSQRY